MKLETKITKQKKEKKDPNKPKGALTAYDFYTKHNRGRIKEENEGLASGEVGKKCGEEWAALDAMDKKKYEDMSAEDKKRNVMEMEAYILTLCVSIIFHIMHLGLCVGLLLICVWFCFVVIILLRGWY